MLGVCLLCVCHSIVAVAAVVLLLVGLNIPVRAGVLWATWYWEILRLVAGGVMFRESCSAEVSE